MMTNIVVFPVDFPVNDAAPPGNGGRNWIKAS